MRVPGLILGFCLLVLPQGGIAQSLSQPAATAPPETADKGTGHASATATELPRLAFSLKVGLVAFGSGKDSADCVGLDCGPGQSRDVGYRHRPSLHLGGEVLLQPLPWLRTGPSIGWSLPGKVEFDAGSRPLEYGSLLSADWVLELTPRIERRSWLLPRIQAGYSMLSPSGGLKSNLDVAESACAASAAQFDGCASIGGLHSGANIGVGLGVLFAAGPAVRLRLDTLAELYWLKMMSVEAAAQSVKLNESNYGSRFLVLGGLEF